MFNFSCPHLYTNTIFYREVESLERAEHINVVKIKDKGYDERLNSFYIVLEYISGKDLGQLFDIVVEWGFEEKINIVSQITEAVGYLHQKNIIPKEIIEEAEEFENKKGDYQKQIDALKTQIIDFNEQIDSEAVPEKERITATQQVRILKKQLEELQNKQESANRILNTYDHRPLLLKALKDAQKQVIIVSPWIKRSGVNNEVLLLIEKALQKKVQVVIGYGISDEQDSDPKILKQLENMKRKKYGNYLTLVSLNNTHEKVLICDNDFLVITSFNWLSFRGDPKFGFRQETGYYTEIKEGIKKMKENLSQRMKIELL